MQLNALRAAFLDYFKKNNHTIVPSSSLIPHNDETLLFTNAGMVQFKEVFLGLEARDYARATSAQRCVRAGGKHNDLDNVGYTARHHTFFEMLGNFSFGDYFKHEAIYFAWDFLTKVLKVPPQKLWVTVYHEDKDAEAIWLKDLKVDPKRFSRCGEKDNFWAMGDTGPCGPCTEIFYDHGESIPGGPPGSEDEDGDRFVEIWNLVFMQYNRDKSGQLTPLPKPSVDTGMGIERMAAVMQGVHSNYDIDLFQRLIHAACDMLPDQDPAHKGYRVLADHIRAVCFLIMDGIIPSNEGRGYVLRRIMRRALRFGGQLGAQDPFFYQMVQPLVDLMGEAYPDLVKHQSRIEKTILKEEEQFDKTLDQGLKILTQGLETCGQQIPADLAFKLYDTYGFPVDLTADMAREKGMTVDLAGFEALMENQKERARSKSQFSVDYNLNLKWDVTSKFTGHDSLEEYSDVIALVQNNALTDALEAGDEGIVILNTTPFYAESGGQVGDTGEITFKDGIFEVFDTQKAQEAILHMGRVKQGTLKKGEKVTASVNADLRQRTVLNHSATHLLHAALREILGTHVVQKGSLVAPDRLRFDFAHFDPMTPEEIQKIEDRVNAKILENTESKVEHLTFDEAIKKGAMALFGEKYGKTVRMLTMGKDFSTELCGGTHAHRTGDIGLFIIIQETGIAAGIRRIEALTGKGALAWLKEKQKTVNTLAKQLKAEEDSVAQKLDQVLARVKQLEKDNERLKHKLASGQGSDLTSEAIDLGGIKVLIKKLDDADPKMMRNLVDDLKNKIKSGVVVLATTQEGKVQLIVGVTKDCTDRVLAGELIKFLATQVGGTGGGRPDMAQAGGTQPEHLEKALKSIPQWIKERI